MASFFAPAPEPPTELGRLRILSASAGVRVSPLQLGAMSLGSAWSGFLGENSKEEVFKLYDAFFEAGGNFIDTANNWYVLSLMIVSWELEFGLTSYCV